MTDHREFALVAMGRALFTSNTDEYCTKLKKKLSQAYCSWGQIVR